MNKTLLIDLIVKKALGYLHYDDQHPDVGMGMSIDTAIRYAKDSILEESKIWQVNFEFPEDINQIEKIAKEKILLKR